MRKKLIGDTLRDGRVKKHLTLDELEGKTNIPSHHLLALELEQFKLIPEDKLESYIVIYSKFVDIDSDPLLTIYRQETTDGPKIVTDLESQDSEIKIVQSKENDSSELSQQPMDSEDVEEVIVTLKTDSTMDMSNSYLSVNDSREQSDSGENTLGKRSSRYKSSQLSSYGPIMMLCIVALGILIFVMFVTWQQLKKDSSSATNQTTSYTVVNSSSESTSAKEESSTSTPSSEETASTSEEEQSTMTTEGEGDSLTVILSGISSSDSVDIVISLSTATSSWISVTNTESNDSGTLLESTGLTSYTATLPAGTTTSLITLGVTEGVTVTVNGQEVDMSALTSTNLSYITVNIKE